MPRFGTFATSTNRAFGLTTKTGIGVVLGDGTVGIFQLGPSTTTRNKFTYATCTSTACGVAAASASTFGSSAAGNSTRGIFALGSTTTTRNKYTYATCTSTACGVASSTLNSSYGQAAGNSTRGIFANGFATAQFCKYTYATCTNTSLGTLAGRNNFQGSAVGNCTRGIFHMTGTQPGACCSSNDPSPVTMKYTYACDTNVNGTNIGSLNGTVAAGNSTRGIFSGGSYASGIGNSAQRYKYTYASCTVTTCGIASASSNNSAGSATGNSTRGIFGGGFGVSAVQQKFRDKYTYACDTSIRLGTSADASANNGASTAVSWSVGVNS